jgi:hypothetical protein
MYIGEKSKNDAKNKRSKLLYVTVYLQKDTIMSEQVPVINFNNTETELYTQVWDATALPDYLWHEAQAVHHLDLLSELRHHNLLKATEMVHIGNLPVYRDRRVDPNTLVGEEFRDYQLFRRPTLTLTFDQAGKVVGGVYMADNTSSTLSNISFPDFIPQKTFAKIFNLETAIKMSTPPRLNLPLVGGKRYVHLREVYTNPFSQEALNLGQDEPVVSAIALIGIYNSLLYRNERQTLAGYQYPGEPIDRGNIITQNALGMKPDEGKAKPNKAGIYQLRATGSIKAIKDKIIKNDRMADLIDRTSVERIVEVSSKRHSA